MDYTIRPNSKLHDPAVIEKLERTKAAAEYLISRKVECPNCGFFLMEVYGTDHHITRAKCQKCKFNELIDTALFRTQKVRNRYWTSRPYRPIK